MNTKDGMKLYQNAKKEEEQKSNNGLRNRKFFKIAGWSLLAFIVINIASNFGNPQPQTSQQKYQSQPTLTDEQRKTFSLLINMHGELCASVTSVQPIAGDTYKVNCIRYRDGTGSASYEVNAATGKVK